VSLGADDQTTYFSCVGDEDRGASEGIGVTLLRSRGASLAGADDPDEG
jgi:hypothetical protein